MNVAIEVEKSAKSAISGSVRGGSGNPNYGSQDGTQRQRPSLRVERWKRRGKRSDSVLIILGIPIINYTHSSAGTETATPFLHYQSQKRKETNPLARQPTDRKHNGVKRGPIDSNQKEVHIPNKRSTSDPPKEGHLPQKVKSKRSWITQRKNISSTPKYRQQEDHQVQIAETTESGAAKVPNFSNNYYYAHDEPSEASITKTENFDSTPVVQSDDWHPRTNNGWER